MKQEDVRYFGDLAKLRDMLHELDQMLVLTGDKTLFTQAHRHEVESIVDSLLHARTGISNLMGRYGDDRGTAVDPPKQEPRDVFTPPSKTPDGDEQVNVSN